MTILNRYYTIIILFSLCLLCQEGKERLLFDPHILRNFEQVFYWELGMSSFFQNFIQHFSFKKNCGWFFFFRVKFMKHFSYLLLFDHLKFKQVLGDSCLLWRTSNLGLFYFISFSIGLDSSSTKKIGTKIWFWSGSWKKKKKNSGSGYENQTQF